MRTQSWRALALAAMLAVPALPALADGLPVPPCADGATAPAYAPVGAPLATTVWKAGDLPDGWMPSACTQWKPEPVTYLLASAGRFEAPDGIGPVLARLAQISRLTTIRYWSDTRDGWYRLFEAAWALDGPDRKARRADFQASQLKPGDTVYFWEDEEHLMKGLAYRMTIRERTPDRLVFETVNVGPMGISFLDMVDPGRFQQLYYLEREAGTTWRYYGLARLGEASPLAIMSNNSLMNRASAYFRYLAGIPTDKEPPAAR